MGVKEREGTRLLGVLAHELRNPLASLQGCAMTLLDRESQLTQDTRQGLTKVIVGQSQRLDWLIRATAALGGAMRRRVPEDVSPSDVVREAATFAGVTTELHEGGEIRADPRRLRLAIEAVFVALRTGGSEAHAVMAEDGAVLEVSSTAKDLEQGERRWKLDLARRLLQEEGCALTIRRTPVGTKARLRFVAPARDPGGRG